MTASASVPLLRAQGLSCRRGERVLFSGLDVTLLPGRLTALTGPNGSGKSTLMRILAGLDAPDSGQVQHANDDDREGRSCLHYYGHRDGLREALSARENVEFLTVLLGGGGLNAKDALARLGAARLIDLPVRVLSAGQRRRVALARLLTAPRPLWLLDEPLTALDAAGQALIADLVREHIAGGGSALVATHQALGVGGDTLRLGGAGS